VFPPQRLLKEIAMGDSTGKFPGPYLNDVKAQDPIMKRVDQDNLEIGARPSGMPKGGIKSEASINHVGETATGKK
jgi:hypothetical protein